MAGRDDLLATIGAIHAASLEPDRWDAALELIARTVGGVGCSLEQIDRGTMKHRFFRAHGLPTAYELAYLAQYAAVNPRWSLVVRQSAGELGWDYRILDEEEMGRSAFYEDFLARVDFRYFAYGMLTATAEEFSGIAVHRSRRQGHVDRAGIARLRQLVPHVRQAFEVSRRLAGMGALGASLVEAIDWLADGVALVGLDGRVVHGNRAFRAMVERRDGIAIQDDILDFALAAARRALSAALAQVARLIEGDPADSATTDFAAARPTGAPAYVVSVRPLIAVAAKTPAAALVMIHDPLSRQASAQTVLRAAFGLTEAEAALAGALQSGRAPGDFARQSGVSLNTVYTHLKRIKEKTGCSRMPALIRKLSDLQAPLR